MATFRNLLFSLFVSLNDTFAKIEVFDAKNVIEADL